MANQNLLEKTIVALKIFLDVLFKILDIHHRLHLFITVSQLLLSQVMRHCLEGLSQKIVHQISS